MTQWHWYHTKIFVLYCLAATDKLQRLILYLQPRQQYHQVDLLLTTAWPSLEKLSQVKLCSNKPEMVSLIFPVVLAKTVTDSAFQSYDCDPTKRRRNRRTWAWGKHRFFEKLQSSIYSSKQHGTVQEKWAPALVQTRIALHYNSYMTWHPHYCTWTHSGFILILFFSCPSNRSKPFPLAPPSGWCVVLVGHYTHPHYREDELSLFSSLLSTVRRLSCLKTFWHFIILSCILNRAVPSKNIYCMGTLVSLTVAVLTKLRWWLWKHVSMVRILRASTRLF